MVVLLTRSEWRSHRLVERHGRAWFPVWGVAQVGKVTAAGVGGQAGLLETERPRGQRAPSGSAAGMLVPGKRSGPRWMRGGSGAYKPRYRSRDTCPVKRVCDTASQQGCGPWRTISQDSFRSSPKSCDTGRNAGCTVGRQRRSCWVGTAYPFRRINGPGRHEACCDGGELRGGGWS